MAAKENQISSQPSIPKTASPPVQADTSKAAKSRQKNRFKRSLYNIAIFSFVVIILWIGFEIYFSFKQGGQTQVPVATKIDAVSPNLHLDTAQSLSGRRSIDQQALDTFKQDANSLIPTSSPEDFDFLPLPDPASAGTPSATPSTQ